MIKKLDRFLNNTTMYRLILYYLAALLILAEILSIFKILPYNPLYLLLSVGFLLLMCWAANTLFSEIFAAPVNVESVYITALILALIITPTPTAGSLVFLGWAAILAMAAKYILAIGHKHVFNPAAISVALTAFLIQQSASWWVATASLTPWVLLGGLLIVRKIRRTRLVISFFITAIITIAVYTLARGSDLTIILPRVLLNTPILFFALVMLTEPLTTPPTKKLQIIYGALVGFLFVPQNHLGGIYSTPELALVIGNIFSYVVSPKIKLLLKLKKIVPQTPDVYNFVFATPQPLSFTPGQYLEWTLDHRQPDNRGNRRYFTIASSPTEPDLILGVKYYKEGSSFKNSLWAMAEDQKEIVASQLAGDFTLPTDPTGKYVFIAGGIGVTPFRSMIKYLMDTEQYRDIIMFYSNKTRADITYKEIFDQAVVKLGIKVVYTLTDEISAAAGWAGRWGTIDEQMIKAEAPDYLDRTFYISGPNAMVDAFKIKLRQLGVKPKNIKTDFFPGFA